MTIRVFVATCVLAVAGCAPVGLWYRAGESVTQLQNDFTDCRVRAVQAVPVNTQIGTTPVHVTPTQTSCYTIGNSVSCSTTGGQVYGGNTYSYDANASLRDDVVAQCMGNLGYTRIELPRCTGAEATQRTAPYDRLPEIGENACAAQMGDDRWVIVNPT